MGFITLCDKCGENKYNIITITNSDNNSEINLCDSCYRELEKILADWIN